MGPLEREFLPGTFRPSVTTTPDLEIRPWVEADRPGMLSLLATSLGWEDDERHDAFFDWKHRESPFGASPAWVATVDGQVAGFRIFQRWRFRRGDELVPAVRAVDTATDPAFRGQGIFSRLTLQAVDEMKAEGVAFVFNNPNQNSRPGFLKMGWVVLGQLPVVARPPRRPSALLRMARAGGATGRWGIDTDSGVAAAEVVGDREAMAALIATQPSSPLIRTDRTAEYLAWRYSFAPLGYRAVLAGSDAREGFAVFRLRHRGPATEALLADVIVPEDDPKAAAALARKVVSGTSADYALAARDRRWPWHSFIPMPGRGHVLTWRELNETGPPDFSRWHLTLGDVELF
jgi:GNAT superfamily N-acetyltransferase